MMYRKRMSSVVGWTRSRSYPGIESAHFLVWPSGAMNLKYVLASCLTWGAGMEDDELQELEQRNTHCTSSLIGSIPQPQELHCIPYLLPLILRMYWGVSNWEGTKSYMFPLLLLSVIEHAYPVSILCPCLRKHMHTCVMPGDVHLANSLSIEVVVLNLYFVYVVQGWGGPTGRQDSDLGGREAQVLWIISLPQEQVFTCMTVVCTACWWQCHSDRYVKD